MKKENYVPISVYSVYFFDLNPFETSFNIKAYSGKTSIGIYISGSNLAMNYKMLEQSPTDRIGAFLLRFYENY